MIVHLTLDQWHALYEPLEDEDGALEEIPFDNAVALKALQLAGRLWTETDDDIIHNSYFTVNRLRYLVSLHPYNPMATIEVYDTYTYDFVNTHGVILDTTPAIGESALPDFLEPFWDTHPELTSIRVIRNDGWEMAYDNPQ